MRLRPPAEHLADVERIQAQKKAAAAAMERLRRLPFSMWPLVLRLHPQLHHSSMVHRLCREAHVLAHRRPIAAERLLRIARSLPCRGESRREVELRWADWHYEHAHVLRLRQRPHDALAALDAAVAACDIDPFRHAWAALERAGLLIVAGSFSEARAALFFAKGWFASLRDARWVAAAEMLQAVILREEGHAAPAKRLLERLEPALRGSEDEPRRQLEVALCDVALRDFDAARSAFARAEVLYEMAAMPIEQAQARAVFQQALAAREVH